MSAGLRGTNCAGAVTLRSVGWNGDGYDRLEVMDAPPRAVFARECLESAFYDYLTVTDDLIRLQADNGVWVYRITGYDPLRDCYDAERV